MLANYKFKNLLLASAALALTGLSSCIMDTYDDNPDNRTTLKAGKYYVAFDIDNFKGAGTRADADGSLVDGTDEDNEHYIGSDGNYILFFDENKKLTELIELLSTKEHPSVDNIEARYIARFDVEEDYEAPRYAMALLNAGRYADYLKSGVEAGMDASDILSLTWSSSVTPVEIGRDGDRFTMSNSIYQDSEGNWIDLVEVPEGVVQDADEEFDESKVVHIYVERMVGKCTLEFENSYIEDGKLYYDNEKDQMLFTGFDEDGIHQYFTAVDWRVQVTGWGMNALETESYLFRHVDRNANYFTGWKDPDNYRVYWAEDPHYKGSDATYPWQYLPAVNNIDVPYYQEFDRRNANVLRNFSYDDFVNANNFDKILYVPENTYDKDDPYIKNGLDKRTEYLAGTHLIVTAILETDLNHDQSFLPNTVYRDRTRILYENEYDCFRALATSFNYALRSQKEMKFTYYNWDNPSDANRGKSYFAQSHGSDFSLCLGSEQMNTQTPPTDLGQYFQEADIYNGDGKLLIYNPDFNIMDSKGNYIRIHDENGNDVTDQFDHKNIVRSLLMEWVGTVDHFKEGRMYYFAPAALTNTMDGVVRNSWYQYVLTGINHIGTSVTWTGNPIVPNRVFEDQQMIDIKINILPWHLGLDATINEGNVGIFDKNSSSWKWPN